MRGATVKIQEGGMFLRDASKAMSNLVTEWNGEEHKTFLKPKKNYLLFKSN